MIGVTGLRVMVIRGVMLELRLGCRHLLTGPLRTHPIAHHRRPSRHGDGQAKQQDQQGMEFAHRVPSFPRNMANRNW